MHDKPGLVNVETQICAGTLSLARWQVMVVVQLSDDKIHNGAKVQAGLVFFQIIFGQKNYFLTGGPRKSVFARVGKHNEACVQLCLEQLHLGV